MAAGDGLVSMTPTSISYSGTSATINTNGGVDFTAVTTLSLNGVFTSDYGNYLMVITHEFSENSILLQCRLRVSGTDASGTNYTYQRLFAGNNNIISGRTTSSTVANIGRSSYATGIPGGDNVYVYGPALAQPTAFRNVNVSPEGGAVIEDSASTHSLSTAYDGITLLPNGGSISGTVHVFGYEE